MGTRNHVRTAGSRVDMNFVLSDVDMDALVDRDDGARPGEGGRQPFMADVVTTLDAAGLLREGTGALASQTVDQIRTLPGAATRIAGWSCAGHREGVGPARRWRVGEYPWGGRRAFEGPGPVVFVGSRTVTTRPGPALGQQGLGCGLFDQTGCPASVCHWPAQQNYRRRIWGPCCW